MDSHEITRHLVARDKLFDFTKAFVVVPNVSYGLLPWEADLLHCTKSGYLTEVEIKISAADWRNDCKKRKWSQLHNRSWSLIKHFYYAAPRQLAVRWKEFDIPEFAGVISLSKRMSIWPRSLNHKPTVTYESEIIRPAKERKINLPLSQEQMMQLARLGSMRIWSLSLRGKNAW